MRRNSEPASVRLGVRSAPLRLDLSTSFSSCNNLSSVLLGNSVTYIGPLAFYGCDNLINITIPDSVTSIGDSAFYGCEKLINDYGYASYLTANNNSHFLLLNATNKNFSTYTLHPDVKIISNYAFENCTSLTSVIIPDNVISIGEAAFWNCTNLISISIGNNVTYIGDWTFYNCTKLKNLYYKGSIEEWSTISIIGSSNSDLASITRYYYSETEPTETGYYWHYVGDVPTKW